MGLDVLVVGNFRALLGLGAHGLLLRTHGNQDERHQNIAEERQTFRHWQTAGRVNGSVWPRANVSRAQGPRGIVIHLFFFCLLNRQIWCSYSVNAVT